MFDDVDNYISVLIDLCLNVYHFMFIVVLQLFLCLFVVLLLSSTEMIYDSVCPRKSRVMNIKSEIKKSTLTLPVRTFADAL